MIPYAIATALAAVSSYVTLAICAGLGVFYAFPISQRRNVRRIARSARSVPPPRAEHAPPVVPRDRPQLGSVNPAPASASSSFGVPATSPSGAGIVAPS